jgi:hypothetical protein
MQAVINKQIFITQQTSNEPITRPVKFINPFAQNADQTQIPCSPKTAKPNKNVSQRRTSMYSDESLFPIPEGAARFIVYKRGQTKPVLRPASLLYNNCIEVTRKVCLNSKSFNHCIG